MLPRTPSRTGRRLFVPVAVALLLLAPAVWADALIPLGGKDSKPSGPGLRLGSPGGEKDGVLDCSGAVEIQLGVPYAGDNSGIASQVDTYGCSNWPMTGGEVILHLVITEPILWEAILTPQECDLDLAVLSECDETSGCLILADIGAFTNVPTAGEFYFIVDGFAGEACPFTFIVQERAPTPVACDNLVQSIPDKSRPAAAPSAPGEKAFYTLSGNTCDGQDLISFLACADYTENGKEHWYEITVQPGGELLFELDHAIDSALWLLAGCQDLVDPICIDFADDFWPETTESVSYFNPTPDYHTLYLVIDSYGVDTCGEYSGLLTLTPPNPIGFETLTWGVLKTRYR